RGFHVTGVQTCALPILTMVVHLISPDKSYDELYLRNYAVMNIKDELAKVSGVGTVRLFGSGDYAMRIWLNPEKIAERHLTANDEIGRASGGGCGKSSKQ